MAVIIMNYIAYRYKLYKLDLKRTFSEKSILKNIEEAVEKGNEETLEKLHVALNADKINYDKNKYKLLKKYFLLQY